MPFIVPPGRNPVIAEAYRLLRAQEKERKAAIAEQIDRKPERKASSAKQQAAKAKRRPLGPTKAKEPVSATKPARKKAR